MSKQVPSPTPLPRPGQQRAWWRAPTCQSALAWFIARTIEHCSVPLLVITQDTQSANQLESDLETLGAHTFPVIHFPDWETLPYDQFSPHPEITSQRLAALQKMPNLGQGVVVVAVQTLMQRLMPYQALIGASFQWHVGQTFDLQHEQSRLVCAGYRQVPQVMDPGDFTTRGGLLDVFPMGTQHPLRIELFDLTIESIRYFDPETQRSLEPIASVELLPGREVPLDDDAIHRALTSLRERFDFDLRRSALYQDLKAGHAPAGIEYYLPLFFATSPQDQHSTSTLFDYLSPHVLPIVTEKVQVAADDFWQQTLSRYEQRRYDVERPVLPPQELFQTPDQWRERLNTLPQIIEICSTQHPQFAKAHALGDQTVPALPINTRQAKDHPQHSPLATFVDQYPGRVIIMADSPGRREALRDMLSHLPTPPQIVTNLTAFLASEQPFALTVGPIDQGFALAQPTIALLTERQLLPDRAVQPRHRRRGVRDPESIIRDLGELSLGAPIVHEDHGVGRYRGLIRMDVGGMPGEFVDIEYAKGDRLYVPVAQLHLITRYAGASSDTAPLHSLGGEQWAKAKRKAVEKIRDVAAELLAIQARRQAKAGIALTIDRTLYEPFAAGFSFEETPDQLSAITATLSDLSNSQPMDRVVCGDVGFGKTEVAIRAAFAAATAGKQVAVLVPTTLLAEQHYRHFHDRFADWPIKVEVLSRFKSPKAVRQTLDQVALGTIDVIVGTHRLLQRDVQFKDLGLVIVDEEQRFGVRQKEALKALRVNVHLLTLTATPIPRTLNMAMSGLRDLSIIATPPPNRLAVQTFLTPWDDTLLHEAFQRELGRGGQLFFLHNDVDSIERMRRQLSELAPQARIGVAHGQMAERELERVMLDFQRQRFNVLICTTIIESGIDIPNANTIIIHRADRFGLAQLHQLRGRVGRSHHRAYAYLIIPDRKAMSGDAQKRLEAIASMDELGAGFMLATHDLEIRGAGELLGEDQSGQMAEIGFSLYTELLERTVRSIRQGQLAATDISQPTRGADVALQIPALIPDDYLPDTHTRLTLYQRIARITDSHQLRELQVEMIDRFGLLPQPVKNLFEIAELALQATALGIHQLKLGERGGRIIFQKEPRVDPETLIQFIQQQPTRYRLQGSNQLHICCQLAQPHERLQTAKGVLLALTPNTPANK